MVKNKARCVYGHYYNADKYGECPVCNPGAIAVPEGTPEESSGVFPSTELIFKPHHFDEMTELLPGSIVTPVSPGSTALPETPFPAAKQYMYPPYIPAGDTSSQETDSTGDPGEYTEEAMTQAVWNVPAGSEPVVGWLICVKGEYFGKSFSLKTGNNTVGRAVNMDVHLALEDGVSRNKHCLITFEPNEQVFYIQQGESRGLSYLNGEIVLSPVKMKLKDKISVGEAEFLLIPLCTDGFRWEAYMNEEINQ